MGIPIGAAVYNFLYMSFDVRDAVLKLFAPCPLGTYPVLPFNQFPAANLLKPLPYAFASAARKIRRCLSSSSGSIIRIRSSMVIPPYNHNTIYFQNSKSIFAQLLKIKSRGFSGTPGRDKSEIFVNNIDYSMNKIGLNIVVIDKETGEVVDSVNINTYSDAGLKINRS